MATGEIILYATDDGQATIQLRSVDGTIWLTQAQMAELFDTTKQNISLHIKNAIAEGELEADSVVKDYLTTAADGKSYAVQHYALKAILSVGYRVRSPRGVQFRRWASTVLGDYLVKGFAMDDARLKGASADHFDELIERIRDIRASEARFYQKLRDILSLSADYVKNDARVTNFYATIQNKMLHAVTNHTAAELIAARSDPAKPNMGVMSWKGVRVRKGDVGTAKNYLAEPEISELNLIVTMFLDTADLRSRRRQNIQLGEWEVILDDFIRNNALPLLQGRGHIKTEDAERLAHERYAAFDERRRLNEKELDAAVPEIDELQRIAEIAASKGKRS